MPVQRRPRSPRLRARIAALQRRLAAMEYACSGTVHTRTRPCGKPNCRCATDPAAWHGPYHDWTRRKEGKLVHAAVSPAHAALIVRGIENRREIERLLARWEDATAAEILGADHASP